VSKVKVALIGLGVMGRNHARVLKQLPDIELVAVFDPRFSNCSDFPMVDNLEGIFQSKPDYCVLATPTKSHEEIILKLVERNINILIEKPLSFSSQSAERIKLRIEKTDLVVGVGHIERFNAALIEAKRRLANLELGRIYQISTRRIGPFPERIVDVGVVLDLATHDIDLTKWIADAEYKSVHAEVFFRTEATNEDCLVAIGKLDSGILVSHNVNWLSPLKERKVVITGEKGTFVVDTLRSDLTLYENGTIVNEQKVISHFRGTKQGQITTYEFEKPEALVTEHIEFIKAILGQQSSYVTLNEAIQTIVVAEQMLTNCDASRGGQKT